MASGDGWARSGGGCEDGEWQDLRLHPPRSRPRLRVRTQPSSEEREKTHRVVDRRHQTAISRIGADTGVGAADRGGGGQGGGEREGQGTGAVRRGVQERPTACHATRRRHCRRHPRSPGGLPPSVRLSTTGCVGGEGGILGVGRGRSHVGHGVRAPDTLHRRRYPLHRQPPDAHVHGDVACGGAAHCFGDDQGRHADSDRGEREQAGGVRQRATTRRVHGRRPPQDPAAD
mmetsp:Transcript_64957/g.141551  ORF Transcript_64957/g.141551 Transcript_64957/m.141551 type:complete len:230 (+) Transcript_64957:346-1035(+)